MKELIPIQENDGKRAVSARDLHVFLESKRDFSTWIKDRIKQYDFVENVDYQSFPEIVGREVGATTRIEYALSVDMAKELSMVEGNEKGKQARKYFIACEKVVENQQKKIENKEKAVSPRTLQLMKLDTAKWLMKNLNYNEVSKLELARALADPLKLPTPAYVKAEDSSIAPTHLLVARGYKDGFTKTFNLIMQKAGLLERKTRPSSSGSGEIRKYWKLTEEGLVYGENQKAPENPRSMQPLYYESKFDELLERLGINTKNTEG